MTTVANRPAAPTQRRPRPDNFDPAESRALVERAQAGDQDAMAGIYLRYRDVIYRFAYGRTGRNARLAEDMTADTFVRAFQRIGNFTWQDRDLAAWLVTIARNRIADYWKGGHARFETWTYNDNGIAAALDDAAPDDPAREVIDHQRNRRLWAAVVLSLSPEQRQCIELRFLHGLNVAETAAAMGRQEGAIKALQYRAIRALRRALGNDFEVTG